MSECGGRCGGSGPSTLSQLLFLAVQPPKTTVALEGVRVYIEIIVISIGIRVFAVECIQAKLLAAPRASFFQLVTSQVHCCLSDVLTFCSRCSYSALRRSQSVVALTVSRPSAKVIRKLLDLKPDVLRCVIRSLPLYTFKDC